MLVLPTRQAPGNRKRAAAKIVAGNRATENADDRGGGLAQRGGADDPPGHDNGGGGNDDGPDHVGDDHGDDDTPDTYDDDGGRG